MKNGRSLINICAPLIGLIIIDILISDVIPDFDLQAIKELIIADVIKGGTWEERGDYEELVDKLNHCNTISEIFHLVLGV